MRTILCAIALMTMLVVSALALAHKPLSRDTHRESAKIAKVTSFNALDLSVVNATHTDTKTLVIETAHQDFYKTNVVIYENKLAFSRVMYPLRS